MKLLSMLDFDRKSIQDIIFRAESTSNAIGVSMIELLDKYAEELKETKPSISSKISAITKQLKSGKKRWDAYKEYVDGDVLELLKIAENKSIPAGVIINSYIPVKSMTSEYRKNIRSNLMGPIGGALFLISLLGYSVMQFKKPIDDGMVVVSDSIVTIASHYYLFNYSFIIVAASLLFLFPHKMPVLNKIFKKLDSLLAIATIETMMQVGYAAAEIIPSIKKQFDLSYEPKQRNIDGLTALLRDAKFITPEESAEIKIATTHDDPKKSLQRLMVERTKDADALSAEIGKTIKTITLVLTAMPVMMMVAVMVSFLTAATQTAAN
jgi:hypothetical protein